MDAALSKLQARLPRPIRRRRKSGDYDAWDEVHLAAKLFFASIFCLVVGWLSYPLGLVLLIFGGLLLPFALPIALGALIKIQRHKHLVKHGYAAVGEVTSSEAHNFPDFGGYHTVLYKFVTNEGVETQGKWEHADKPFWNSKRGDEFIVIYQPRRPSSHIAYESALYEVES